MHYQSINQMNLRKNVLFFALLLGIYSIFAQNNYEIDSLKAVIKTTKIDTVKPATYLKLGKAYNKVNKDSSLFYFAEALKLAQSYSGRKTEIKRKMNYLQVEALTQIIIFHLTKGEINSCRDNANKAMALVTKYNNKTQISTICNLLAYIQSAMGENDSAIIYNKKSLKIDSMLNNAYGMLSSYINLGLCYKRMGDFSKALEYYLLALNVINQNNELSNYKGNVYNNIGIIHKNIENYNTALTYYQKARNEFEAVGNNKKVGNCYINIGILNSHLNNYDVAITHYEKALEIMEKYDDKVSIAKCYSNLGNIYLTLKEYDKSIIYLTKGIEIKEEIGDKTGLAFIYKTLSKTYMEIADSLKNQGNQKGFNGYIERAYNNANKALSIAKLTNDKVALTNTYVLLKDISVLKNHYKIALEFFELSIPLKDSLFSKEKTKTIAEMSAKYETERKQLQIEKMAKQKQLDNHIIKNQRNIITLVIISLFVFVSFSLITFRLYRQKLKAHLLLSNQHYTLETQKIELEIHRKNTIQSLSYAEHIQGSLLTNPKYFEQNFSDYFIFYRPKNIVSGDFYWLKSTPDKIMIAMADCTGHGVPGAFMSVLGISFLNEITQKKNLKSPAKILEKLRKKVKDTLNPELKTHKSKNYIDLYLDIKIKDGMDMAFCSIDKNNLKMTYSGANLPIYIIRNNELIELEPEMNPIGVYLIEQKFKNCDFQLIGGDMIYLFSDGYYDQFGGKEQKKFFVENFKALLKKVTHLDCAKQKERLVETLENWQGINEQVDDVTVIGLRI